MSRRNISRTVMLLIGALSAIAAFSPAAFAAGAPVITAETPHQVNLNAEGLSGTVDPNGAETTYKVEYGRTKLYGQSTPSLSASIGAVKAFALELPGLQPMSTYHYRVSATNSFGTTTTTDALFENLLSWKVAGTPVESLADPATYEDKYKGGAKEGGKIEFRGFSLNKGVRIYCRQSAASTGILGFEYANLVFNNGCFTQVEGVTNANCKPSGVTLHLNGNFAQTASTKVVLGEACPVGEQFIYNFGGFGPGATSEATENSLDMAGTTYFIGGNKPWDVEFSLSTTTTTGAWKLTGVNAGKVFGIS